MPADDVQLSLDEEHHVLLVTGELDAVSAAELREQVLLHSHDFSKPLVVDLSGVQFLPSVAVGVLATTLRSAANASGSLELLAAEGTIAQRVLQITALPHRTV